MVIFSLSKNSKKIKTNNNSDFLIDMDFIDQDGINSIMFYYKLYGDKIINHIPEKYYEEFIKKTKI